MTIIPFGPHGFKRPRRTAPTPVRSRAAAHDPLEDGRLLRLMAAESFDATRAVVHGLAVLARSEPVVFRPQERAIAAALRTFASVCPVRRALLLAALNAEEAA